MPLYKKVGNTLLSSVKVRVDKIIEVSGKVLKKVEQKGLLLEELEKIEKSIVKSEKPLQIITTSLPCGVKNFDKVVVEEGNGFLTEVLSFKNDKGETLLKTINRSKEDGDSFFTMRRYQQDLDSEVIHTNKFKNLELISSQQETMTKGLYGDSFTKTKIVKNDINGKASHDIHSIGEYKQSKSPKEFQFSFDRDADGYISSELSVEKNSAKLKLNFYDKKYLPILLSNNKSEIALDLIRSEVTKLGIPLMPSIKISPTLKKYGEFVTYHLVDAGENVRAIDIIPEFSINSSISKSNMVNTGAHEGCHMKQDIRTMMQEKIYSMETQLKSWWEKTIKNRKIPKRGSFVESRIQKYIKANDYCLQTDIDFKSGKINEAEFKRRYEEDILEKDAKVAGSRAEKHYSNLFSKFSMNLRMQIGQH